MARRRKGPRDETEMSPLLNDDDEAGQSTSSNGNLRFMVLGGDDVLMNTACGTILRESERGDAFENEILELRTARVCERKISVLKTPSYWLKQLKSYTLFRNGVKSIRNEVESNEAKMFPGPHAFLLVHRHVEKSENYLLYALSDVFGKEVLDYCLVLFLDDVSHNDAKQNYCVKMCGGRYHILKNTDENVNKLVEETETMTRSKHSFFTKHLDCFTKANNYFQKEYKAVYEEKANKLKKELAEKEKTAESLKNKTEHMTEQNAKKESELNEANSRLSKELDDIKSRENKLREEFYTSIQNERQLHKDLIIYKDRENQLKYDKEKLEREVEQLKNNEKQLQNNLTEAKVKEDCLVTKLQSEFNITQKEQEVQAKEKQMHGKEKELQRREKELDDRERNLNKRQKELEIRERKLTDARSREHHQTTADTPSAVSGEKNRPLDECEGELQSRHDSQASGSLGIQKLVRRNSKEIKPPNMPESEPQHTL